MPAALAIGNHARPRGAKKGSRAQHTGSTRKRVKGSVSTRPFRPRICPQDSAAPGGPESRDAGRPTRQRPPRRRVSRRRRSGPRSGLDLGPQRQRAYPAKRRTGLAFVSKTVHGCFVGRSAHVAPAMSTRPAVPTMYSTSTASESTPIPRTWRRGLKISPVMYTAVSRMPKPAR